MQVREFESASMRMELEEEICKEEFSEAYNILLQSAKEKIDFSLETHVSLLQKKLQGDITGETVIDDAQT
jgi:hemerythrin superfamily protein